MNEIPSTKKPKIHPSWFREIEGEFKKPYMASLRSFLVQEKSKGVKIYPPSDQIFTAINITSLDNTKVVIIGQDPYHKFNQAHGLSFSVKPEVKIPPSLVNIFKELNDDLGCKAPNHGFLQSLIHLHQIVLLQLFYELHHTKLNQSLANHVFFAHGK